MVEYTVVNVITAAVGMLFLYSGYRFVKHGREDIALFVASSAIGFGLIVVAVYPGVFEVVANLIGLELKARAILVVSNLTLFVLVTYLFNRISKLYDRVSVLNEELSLLRSAVEEEETTTTETNRQNDD